MKKLIRNIAILVIPFLAMVVINETVRPTIKESPYKRRGVTAINSVVKTTDKCSWSCHDDTDYCKANHVEVLKHHFEYVDPFYFGIVHSLKSVGNYRVANVVFLVILLPLLMYLLIVKSLNIQDQIRELKKANE